MKEYLFEKSPKVRYIFKGLPFFWFCSNLTGLIEKILFLSKEYDENKGKD